MTENKTIQISVIDGEPKNLPKEDPIAKLDIVALQPTKDKEYNLPSGKVHIYRKGTAKTNDLEIIIVARYDLRGAEHMPEPNMTRNDLARWFTYIATSLKVLTGWVKT